MMFLPLLLTLLISLENAYCQDEKSLAASFLSAYNYVPQTRSGAPDLTAATKKFQSLTGLPVTGELDQATIEEMKKPRCGVVDEEPEARFHTYKRWSKNHLKYYIWFSRDKHLSYELQEDIFKRAFNAWSTAAPKLSFNRTYCLKDADIKITFGYKVHAGPGEKQCEKPLNNWVFFADTAHSFYPEDGRIHINEAVDWGQSIFRTDLYTVALHEIGHALGLKHSQYKDSLMYPSYSRYRNKLTKDDIEGIRALYG